MKIDPVTMLFSDFDLAERGEMYDTAEAIVLKGKVPYPRPPWMQSWLETCGFPSDSQYLLTVSTVLPTRVFLSILRQDLIGYGHRERAESSCPL